MKNTLYQVSLVVQDQMLDLAYKHMHHAQILIELEKVKLSFMNAIGYSCPDLISKGLFPVVSEIKIKYLREIREGSYLVTCQDRKVLDRKFYLRQELINGKGKLAVEAEFECMIISAGSARAIKIDDEFATAFVNGVYT